MPDDTAKVNVLNWLGKRLLRRDLSAAFEYAGEAILLSRKLDYAEGLAAGLRNRADLYGNSGLFDLGTRDAMDALKIFEERGDSLGISDALTSLGGISFYMHATDPAVEYYNQALAIHKAMGNERGILSVQNNIASALANAESFEEALVYYLRNLKALETMKIPRLKGITLNNIGAIYQELDRCEKALPYFLQAESLYVASNDQMGLAGVYQNLAESNLILKNLSAAERYIQLSADLTETSGSPARKLEILNFRSKVLAQKGQYKMALDTFRSYHLAKEQLDIEGQSDKVAKLRAAFEADKKLNEVTQERDLNAIGLARRNAENRNQRLLIYSFIVGFVLLLILVVLQIRNNRIRTRTNAQLRQQKQEIEFKNQSLLEATAEIERINQELQTANAGLEATVEKRTGELVIANTHLVQANDNLDTFIYRASHDLRGPLSRIQGLANVVRGQADLETATHYVEMMNVACDRMDQVLRKLILVREIPRLEHSVQKIDLPELIGQVNESLLRLEDFGAFEVKLKGEQGFLHQDAKRVRIVLENLLENAYIFRKDHSSKSAEAEVHFHAQDGYFFIEVLDEGIGIDPGHREKVFDLFFRGSDRSTGNGVGLYLAQEATRSMGGTIGLESEFGQYSRFQVIIKDLKG